MRIQKILILILSFFIIVPAGSDIRAQCNTYIQMRAAVECVLPFVISTGEYLMPCAAPPEFYQLKEGDYAYLDYEDSGCISFCQQGDEVDITCVSIPVSVDDQESVNRIKVFPTLVQSRVFIEGKDIMEIELFNDRGALIEKLIKPDVDGIDVANLVSGIYIIKIVSKNRIQVRKIFKL